MVQQTQLNFHNIPSSLKEQNQWVLWRYEGKDQKKMPRQKNGLAAKANDPQTWDSFDNVVTAYNNGGFDGIAFEFHADDDFVGIDLDGCRNPETGEIEPWADSIINQLDTYAEISPSQTGVKLFIRGKFKQKTGKKKPVKDVVKIDGKEPAIEIYDHGRMFCMTGWTINQHLEPEPRQSELDKLDNHYFSKPVKSSSPPIQYTGNSNLDRCMKYVAAIPGAIAGQSGHNATFAVACVCFRFGLTMSEALRVMQDFNARCSPEWSESEIQHKLDGAETAVSNAGQFGDMINKPFAESVPTNFPKSNPAVSLNLVCLSDVEAEEIEWLWPGRIALKRVTQIAGDGGTGKSYLCYDLAARISTGREWPDSPGINAPLGNVIILNSEDNLGDTIKVRLETLGANCDFIHYVQGVTTKDYEREFSLKQDVEQLEAMANQLGNVKLIIIDPISSYLIDADSNNAAEVRAILDPLKRFAERIGAAVILVNHFTKAATSAVYKACGSIAIQSMVRASWVLGKDRNNPERRIFVASKFNSASEPTGLAFQIVEGKLVWESEPVTITADELLAYQPDKVKRQNVRDEAGQWLMDKLSQGPIESKKLIDEGIEEGYSEQSMRRAKRKFNIEHQRIGGSDGHVIWGLNLSNSDQDSNEDHTLTTWPSLNLTDDLRNEIKLDQHSQERQNVNQAG